MITRFFKTEVTDILNDVRVTLHSRLTGPIDTAPSPFEPTLASSTVKRDSGQPKVKHVVTTTLLPFVTSSRNHFLGFDEDSAAGPAFHHL